MRELVDRRTPHSKTWDLGGGKRRLDISHQPFHFWDGERLADIDLVPVRGPGRKSFARTPYDLAIFEDRCGYVYVSQTGRTVSAELIFAYSKVEDYANGYKWSNADGSVEHVIYPQPAGVTSRVYLHNADVRKEWQWRVDGDLDLFQPIVGRDARGRSLELIQSVENGILTVTWTGKVATPGLMRKKKAELLEPIYPVWLDPTVNEVVTTTTDDGGSYNNSGPYLSGATIYVGNYVSAASLTGGWRFQTVNVPQGSTIDSATFSIEVISTFDGTPTLRLYGVDSDDTATWSGGNKITSATITTASTAITTWSTTGVKNVDVTSVVQEIVDRVGWAANNDMSLVIYDDGTSAGGNDFTVGLADLNHATAQEGRLSITYTVETVLDGIFSSAGAGTATATAQTIRYVDGIGSAAGAATATGVIENAASVIQLDGTFSSDGVATAEAVNEYRLVPQAAASADGIATAEAVGEFTLIAQTEFSLDGTATAEFAIIDRAAPVIVEAAGYAAGEATAVAKGFFPEIPRPGGAGLIGGPFNRPEQHIRIRRPKPKRRHLIKIGHWPEEEPEPELAPIPGEDGQIDIAEVLSRLADDEQDDDDDIAAAMILTLAM